MQGEKASIFTTEQEEQLRNLKAHFPFRIVWGAVNADTGEFEAQATSDRRRLMKRLRAGWLVAIVG